MSIDAETLDRIDVRYQLEMRFEVKDKTGLAILYARTQITCGTYEGIPTKEILKDLMNSRKLYEDDVYSVTNTSMISTENLVKTINDRKILENEVEEAKIISVIVDEKEVAHAL